MDYCDVACSSIGKIERIEKGGQDCLEDQNSDPEKNLKWLPKRLGRGMHE